jgi:hypothetical protein
VGVVTRRELRIDRDGIQQRVRGKTTLIRWTEPHDFCYRAVAVPADPASEKVTVRTGDGRKIDVDTVPIAGQPGVRLPTLVEKYSTTTNWPKIQARLKAGENVEFGAVQVNQQRVLVGELSYPRERPITLQIERGQIQIGAEGTWVTSNVSFRDVANYPCLLRAIGQVTTVHSA